MTMTRTAARLDSSRPGSGLRLVALVIAVLGSVSLGGYLLYVPAMQLYWGTYARMNPMVSLSDLMKQGSTTAQEALLRAAAATGAALPTSLLPQQTALANELKENTTLGPNEDQAQADAHDEGGEGADEGATAAEREAELVEAAEEGEGASGGAEAGTQQEASKEEPAGTALSASHRLTKELVDEVAKGGVVVITWANFHYRDFVMNWVEHLQATGCTSFLVGAMDDEILQVLIDAKVPAFAMSSGLTTTDFGWGSATFHKMGREKISLIQTFTRMGQDVIISDVDTVWMKNPVEYVAQYPDADILTSSDHLSDTTAHDGGLEHFELAGSAANIGIMLFRTKAAPLADEWVKVLENDSKVWDQNAFNDLFRRGSTMRSDRPDRLFLGYDGTLLIGILPVSLFCSGHTYFTQDMPGKLGVQPYVAHATFQFSGTPGKRNRFRERLLWSDPPEYFNATPGFVTVAPLQDLEALKQAAGAFERTGTLNATKPHFDLVHRQLSRVRTLFALAATLGRAAVLPPLWCGQDRWWAPHSGVIPGSDLTLPFLCPADHVLDLEAMERERDAPGYIPWREYSFLDNPRAAGLRNSTLRVATCKKAGGLRCSDGSAPAKAKKGVVRLRPGLTDQAIATALKDVAAEYAVLHFDSPEALWGGFADAQAAEAFKQRMDQASSIFCCVAANPGHVWYDMYWDQGAHRDRHNREIGEVWEPQTGP